jgi:hypothetical protein
MHAAAAADKIKTRKVMLLAPFWFAASVRVVAADIKSMIRRFETGRAGTAPAAAPALMGTENATSAIAAGGIHHA